VKAFLLSVVAIGGIMPLYAYVLYPMALRLLAVFGRSREEFEDREVWPVITVSIPAYNEEAVIGSTLENLLRVDYPSDRMHVLVLSDASTDQTDAIVRGFVGRGVELWRAPRRVGKTEMENLSGSRLRGEIVVNTDAAVRIGEDSLKPLVAALDADDVGVASGRDVSVGDGDDNSGESRYVGYEMAIRDLETRVGGIVGASGCFYAIRRHLHAIQLPDSLSRDFAAPLIARKAGYRAVSIADAVCVVPRVGSIGREYRRKVRTIARGLQTLMHTRSLLNPFRYGLFAWMLFSHKLCRWLVPWAMVAGLIAVALLALDESWARWVLVGAGLAGALSGLGTRVHTEARPGRLLALLTYFVAGNLAVLHAWIRAVKGDSDPSWEPTRRPSESSA
jgi:cellulose synthase/poly-beta-1,6-N-acetylglucosamine synthase-like glycosyltransferase